MASDCESEGELLLESLASASVAQKTDENTDRSNDIGDSDSVFGGSQNDSDGELLLDSLADEIVRAESKAKENPTHAATLTVKSFKLSSSKVKRDVQDAAIEKYSGLRIRNRVVSGSELDENMQGKTVYTLDRLSSGVIAKLQGQQERISSLRGMNGCSGYGKAAAQAQQSSDWVTIGVLSQARTLTSAKGAPYLLWKISDLNKIKMTSVSVFLFQNSFTAHKELKVGSIILLLNPKVMPAKNEGGTFSFSIQNSGQVVRLGASLDFGYCVFNKPDGTKCRNVINKQVCSYCDFHTSAMYTKLKSGRMGLNSSSGYKQPKSMGIRSTHLSHGSFDVDNTFNSRAASKSRAGRFPGNGGTVTTKKSGTTKPVSRLTKCKLELGFKKPEPSKKSNFIGHRDKKMTKANANTTILRADGSVMKQENTLQGKSFTTSRMTQCIKRRLESTIKQNGKFAIKSGLSRGRQRFATAIGVDLKVSVNDRKREIERTQRELFGNTGTMSYDEKVLRRNEMDSQNMDLIVKSNYNKDSRKRSRSQTEQHVKVAEMLRSKGKKIQRVDPNSNKISDLRWTHGKEKTKQSGMERTTSSVVKKEFSLERLPQKQKCQNSLTVTSIGKQFGILSSKDQELMLKRKSKHAEQAENKRFNMLKETLNSLESREVISDKLAAVTSIKVNTYKCHDCNLILEKILDKCKLANHRIEKKKSKKRFFSCGECGNKIDTLGSKLPKHPCHRCRNDNWKRCSMYSDRVLGQNSAVTSAVRSLST